MVGVFICYWLANKENCSVAEWLNNKINIGSDNGEWGIFSKMDGNIYRFNRSLGQEDHSRRFVGLGIGHSHRGFSGHMFGNGSWGNRSGQGIVHKISLVQCEFVGFFLLV